jgi:hypothetical protein
MPGTGKEAQRRSQPPLLLFLALLYLLREFPPPLLGAFVLLSCLHWWFMVPIWMTMVHPFIQVAKTRFQEFVVFAMAIIFVFQMVNIDRE